MILFSILFRILKNFMAVKSAPNAGEQKMCKVGSGTGDGCWNGNGARTTCMRPENVSLHTPQGGKSVVSGFRGKFSGR